MRFRHRLARVLLWAARSPADHLGYQVLESRGRYAMVRFVYQGISIESRVDHDPVDKIVDHGGDAVNAAQPVVERSLFCWLHPKPPRIFGSVPEWRSERNPSKWAGGGLTNCSQVRSEVHRITGIMNPRFCNPGPVAGSRKNRVSVPPT